MLLKSGKTHTLGILEAESCSPTSQRHFPATALEQSCSSLCWDCSMWRGSWVSTWKLSPSLASTLISHILDGCPPAQKCSFAVVSSQLLFWGRKEYAAVIPLTNKIHEALDEPEKLFLTVSTALGVLPEHLPLNLCSTTPQRPFFLCRGLPGAFKWWS